MDNEQNTEIIKTAANKSTAFKQRVSNEIQCAEGDVGNALIRRSTLLKAAGYYDGEITTEHNEALTEATENFQRDHMNAQASLSSDKDDLTQKMDSQITGPFNDANCAYAVY